VALKCDVELGGTDQKFNLMRGRDLQRHFGQKPQIILMTPILEGLDGVQKMSKSLGNAIGIKDPAAEMYGKLMSISDELMWRYWTFLTDLPQSKIDAMRQRVKDGAVHPMDVKKELALTITAGFHGVQTAEQAAQAWSTQFQQKGVAQDLPEVEISASADALVADGVVRLPKLLVLAGLAGSAGEAQRKIAENAVSVNGEKVTERNMSREVLGDAPALRLGKKAVRVRWVK
jgi:tyrosyl-tRNA synthetase